MADQDGADLVGGTPLEEDIGAEGSATPAEGKVEETTSQEAEAEPEVEAEPQTVPYKQYARMYGEAQEAKKRIKELESRGAPRSEAPAPKAKPQAGKAEEFVDQRVDERLSPVLEALNEIRGTTLMSTAKELLSDFWAENPDFVAHRGELDSLFLDAVRKGEARPEKIDPNLILDMLVGRESRHSVQAKRTLSTKSVERTAKANASARSEAGNRAPPAHNKKFTEKSTAEIEAEMSNNVIWKRGQRIEDEE